MLTERQPDPVLWTALKNGDRRAFADLYQRYYRALYQDGYQLLPDAVLVADAIQDLFVDLWRTRQNLADSASARFYLFQALHREIHRLSGKENRFRSVDDAASPFPVDTRPEQQLTDPQGIRMWAAIEQRTAGLLGDDQQPEEETAGPWSWPKVERPNWWQLAAAVVLLAGIGWWFSLRTKLAERPETYAALVARSKMDRIEKINNTVQPLTVPFADGSAVVLQPNSRVSYPAVFADKNRDVYLSGEGFFEVSRNPEKPFLVYANGLVAKAVETRFTVKAPEKTGRVTVIVRSGEVAVFSLKSLDGALSETGLPKEAFLLTANQRAFFDTGNGRLTRQTE
ncbi:hypothetical protein GCM10027299_32730 [Larkinella ripae]